MKISAQGTAFICVWEAFASHPYQDASGITTWGYGHARRAREPVPASITEEQASALMVSDLCAAEDAVNRLHCPLSQQQFDALVSLAYNAGAAAVGINTSSLARYLVAGKPKAAALCFGLWNKVRNDGALFASAGLTIRRAAECRVFEDGVYDATH